MQQRLGSGLGVIWDDLPLGISVCDVNLKSVGFRACQKNVVPLCCVSEPQALVPFEVRLRHDGFVQTTASQG
jgi:hypothetical protein